MSAILHSFFYCYIDLLLSGCFALGTCLLADFEWGLLKILAAEEGKVAMVGEAIHLDDAL
jgi:hypothetical protein